MVSARPTPSPIRGRISYPTAATYTPGDDNEAPTYTGSEPLQQVTSPDSDKWWKTSRKIEETEESHVFGVPLAETIKYASVQISTVGSDDKLYVWGVIPVVVAKCGLYLKEHATEVEGAFRISGSAKRMRELQSIFETGPKYGKNIDWKALDFSPHDVATIFRRFLTQAPESIIPTDFYEEFRAVLSDEISVEEAILRYKDLIRSMPPINQYLLLYVLDLLSVFARKADKNLMSAPNLALIFQPGVLSHPVHAMRPREHVLSQQVLEFLIEHQDNFLIGMQLKRKGSKTREAEPKEAEPEVPTRPAPVKADPDLMPPSDSDEEAPAGGYYVIEGEPRSPIPAFTELPPPNLLPPSPTKPLRTVQPPAAAPATTTVYAATAAPAAPTPPAPVIHEEFEPSDSDDDVPAGGYVVRISDAARARAAAEAVAKQSKPKRTGSLTARLRGRKNT